jgi:hypothetical protein
MPIANQMECKIMSKIANGFVLFSLLLALSLGVAFAEGPAATETVPANNTSVIVPLNNTTATNNTTIEAPLNNTPIAEPKA